MQKVARSFTRTCKHIQDMVGDKSVWCTKARNRSTKPDPFCVMHLAQIEHPYDMGGPASLTAACSMAAPKFLWELMRILSFLALCKADMALCLYPVLVPMYLCLYLCTVLVPVYLCLYLCTCACTYVLCLHCASEPVQNLFLNMKPLCWTPVPFHTGRDVCLKM